MTDDPSREGALVFGKITANITHEIKNSLAIIKEISGLQSDLIAAAQRGRPLDPEKIASLACRISSQVERADETIKRLNRFSHTVDQAKKTVDMGEEIGFIIALTERLFKIKCLSVKFSAPVQPVDVVTDPFWFAAAMFSCLQAAMESAGGNGVVEVTVSRRPGGGVAGFTTQTGQLTLSPETRGLLDRSLARLEACVCAPGQDHPLELFFPAHGAAESGK